MEDKRKPRSDSKLDSLKPESRVLELRDKLLANAKHEDVLAWLAVECGVTVASSALTTFYKRHCWPLVRDRRLAAVAKSEALGEAMERDPANWDKTIAESVKQRLFEWILADKDDPEAMGKLLDSITKARKQEFHEKTKTKDQELAERALALQETKASRMDALEAKAKEIRAGGGLSPETLEVLEKQLKLL
jgi:hypothetical protein